MSNLTENHDILVAAERARREIENEMESAIRQATAKIREDFRARRVDASRAVNEAQAAYDAAKIAEAVNNPLVGKKVKRAERVPVSRWSSKFRDEISYGVVEVKTKETVLPTNIRSGLSNGQCFVRLMKKDGTLGVKIASLTSAWEIAE